MKFGTVSRLVFGVTALALIVGIGVARSDMQASGDASGVQVAQTSLADTIAKRQQAMKDTGANAKAINDFVESGTGSAEDVGKRAGEIKAVAAAIPDLFPAGTSLNDNVAKTAAKPEIWDNFDEFKAAAAKMGELAGALQDAAGTGDKQKIADAFGALGKDGCGGCHSKFRLKTP